MAILYDLKFHLYFLFNKSSCFSWQWLLDISLKDPTFLRSWRNLLFWRKHLCIPFILSHRVYIFLYVDIFGSNCFTASRWLSSYLFELIFLCQLGYKVNQGRKVSVPLSWFEVPGQTFFFVCITLSCPFCWRKIWCFSKNLFVLALAIDMWSLEGKMARLSNCLLKILNSHSSCQLFVKQAGFCFALWLSWELKKSVWFLKSNCLDWHSALVPY